MLFRTKPFLLIYILYTAKTFLSSPFADFLKLLDFFVDMCYNIGNEIGGDVYAAYRT